jgi:hypothetical protein
VVVIDRHFMASFKLEKLGVVGRLELGVIIPLASSFI